MRRAPERPMPAWVSPTGRLPAGRRFKGQNSYRREFRCKLDSYMFGVSLRTSVWRLSGSRSTFKLITVNLLTWETSYAPVDFFSFLSSILLFLNSDGLCGISTCCFLFLFSFLSPHWNSHVKYHIASEECESVIAYDRSGKQCTLF